MSPSPVIYLFLTLSGAFCDSPQEEHGSRLPPPECRTKPPRTIPNGNVFKWFYNVSSTQCELVLSSVSNNSSNLFETEQSCNIHCRDIHYGICAKRRNESICSMPQELRFWFNPLKKACEPFAYGHCDEEGNSFRTRISCLLECADFVQDRCILPIDLGHCENNLTRFGYNQNLKACESFSYTGCGGNKNNFLTAYECWTTCAKDSRCLKKTYENSGWYRPYTSYFYDVKRNQCRPTKTFFRKTFSRKNNRFVKKEDCERVCKRKSEVQKSISVRVQTEVRSRNIEVIRDQTQRPLP